MNKEFDNTLCNKYPKIFRDRYAPMDQTGMCWGFGCGDGWYDLIDVLCNSIQNHVDWDIKMGKEPNQVVATQVKEKFGTLRFYYMGGDEYVDGLVSMAESMSSRICEICGSKGTLVDKNRWYQTLCEKHSQQEI